MIAKKKNTKRISPTPFYAGPGKRYYINQLNFLLNFLNADIEKLPPGDFSNLFYQALLFLYENHVNEGVLRRIFTDTDEDRRQLSYVQEILKYKVNALKELEIIYNEDEGLKTLEIEKSGLYSYCLKDGIIIYKPYISLYIFEDIQPDNGEELYIRSVIEHPKQLRDKRFQFDEDGIDTPEPPTDLIPGKFSMFLDDNIYETVKFSCYSLFEKIPVSAINLCPYCYKYFKSTSKKQSPLCARCLKKENTYKWREQNKLEYNEYQRNLQKGVKTSVKDIREKMKRN
ncbi:MAG: hypothetical protein ACFE8P_12050, partial [Promethearchaeota archaeon]